MRTLIAVLLLCPPLALGAPAPLSPSAAPAAPQGEVAVSTTATVDSLYSVSRMRDPFARAGGGHGRTKAFSQEDFSIHKLSLRAIMRDSRADFALFLDGDAGVSLLLRKGRLFDPKKRPIPGIGGSIDVRRRMATLTAPDGDVQVFRLGEEERD